MSPTPHVYALVDIGPGDGMSDSLLGVFGTREQAEAEIEECVRDGFPNTALWWQIREITVQLPPKPEPEEWEEALDMCSTRRIGSNSTCVLLPEHDGNHIGVWVMPKLRLPLVIAWNDSKSADRTEVPV